MQLDKLKELTLKDIEIDEIHPFHDLMLEECCENALKNQADDIVLVKAVQIAFLTANSALKGLVKAGLENAETVTIKYRNQKLIFDNNSTFIKE